MHNDNGCVYERGKSYNSKVPSIENDYEMHQRGNLMPTLLHDISHHQVVLFWQSLYCAVDTQNCTDKLQVPRIYSNTVSCYNFRASLKRMRRFSGCFKWVCFEEMHHWFFFVQTSGRNILWKTMSVAFCTEIFSKPDFFLEIRQTFKELYVMCSSEPDFISCF